MAKLDSAVNDEEVRYHKNQYANEILKHCAAIGLSRDEFRYLTGLSENQLFNNKGGFNDDPAKQAVFKLNFVSRLFMGCGIHPTTFLRKRDQEGTWFDLKQSEINKKNREIEKSNLKKKKKKKKLPDINKDRFFTNDYWDRLKGHFVAANSIIKYIRIESHDADSNSDLEYVYKNILVPYFTDAERSIKVYEVLFKGNNREPNSHKAYPKAQKHVLTAIENWLDNKKEENKERAAEGQEPVPYEYIRTIACTRSTFLFRKDGEYNLKQAMVLESSTTLLEHLKYCLEKHKDHCKFYVASTSRLRNHAIIDDKYSLTEDYVVQNNIVVPDGIFINDITENSKTFPFKMSLEKQAFRGERFRKKDLLYYLIKGYFFVLKKSKEKVIIADLIREKLDMYEFDTEEVASIEQDKGEVFHSYISIALKKITTLGYNAKLMELKRKEQPKNLLNED